MYMLSATSILIRISVIFLSIIYVAFGQYAFVDKDETVISKILLQVVNVCVIQLQEVVNVIRKAVNDYHGWNRETAGMYSILPDFGLSQYSQLGELN